MKKHLKHIACLLLALAMVLTLTGCGETKKAEETINNAFAALKSLNFEAASSYIDLDEITGNDAADDSIVISDELLMKSMFGKLEHEIVSSEKIDDNTVVVKTKISALDMKPVLTEFIQKAFQYAIVSAFSSPKLSDEELNKKMEEMFLECISKENLTTITSEVDIRVIKTENTWKIETDTEFANALLGGMITAAEEISNAFAKAN